MCIYEVMLRNYSHTVIFCFLVLKLLARRTVRLMCFLGFIQTLRKSLRHKKYLVQFSVVLLIRALYTAGSL